MYVAYDIVLWRGCCLFCFVSFCVAALEMLIFVEVFSWAVKIVHVVMIYLPILKKYLYRFFIIYFIYLHILDFIYFSFSKDQL